jgi:threonine-phosphate decarboxylase
MAGGGRMRLLEAKAVHGGDVWSCFPVIDFSSNVNPLGPPAGVLGALRDNLWRVSLYPDDSGRELKEAVAEYAGVGEENIILGNGSTEVIKGFAEGFIAKGDHVILPIPTYSEYEYQALLRGAEITYLSPRGDLSFSVEGILSAIEEKPRALFLCDPNNPTGKTLRKHELRRVLEAAHEEEVLVLLDEAYIEFADRPCFQEAAEYENLLVSRSLTKFFALPGLRLGYGIGSQKIVALLERLRIPWNVNALAQVAGIEALKDKGFAETSRRFVKAEREFLRSKVEGIGLATVASDTNFFLINLGGRIASAELKARLLDKKILIRDCSSFKGLGEDYIRVSVKQREENLRLIRELKRVMEGLDG